MSTYFEMECDSVTTLMVKNIPNTFSQVTLLAEIDDLVDSLSIMSDIIDPSTIAEPLLRDANDQQVLGTLLAAMREARADYLITGDKDLLVLSDGYPILTPAQFWGKHAGP